MTAIASTAMLSHLERLEAKTIHILRKGGTEGRRPLMLFSTGKDSTVLAHLALRVFYPGSPPFPLPQIDSTWEFRSLLALRDASAARHGFELIVHANEEGRAAGLNPDDHGETYTTAMRTDPLKQALALDGYDIVFGGARRDEERSRAKEQIFSVCNAQQGWEPRQQRPELWQATTRSSIKGSHLASTLYRAGPSWASVHTHDAVSPMRARLRSAQLARAELISGCKALPLGKGYLYVWRSRRWR